MADVVHVGNSRLEGGMLFLLFLLVGCAPLGLVRGKDLPLGVVANDLDVEEAPNVELLRPEHRHLGGWPEFVVSLFNSSYHMWS